MVRRAALVLPALLLAPAAVRAQQEDYPSQERYHLRVEYRDYHPSLEATMQHGNAEEPGTPLDLTKDLAVLDERTYEVRGAIQIARGHKLRGSYTPLDYRGEMAEAKRDFIYGNTEFERFEPVASTFKGAYYGADYEYDFVKNPRGYLGAFLGARLLDLDVIIAATDRNVREVDTVRTPLPIIGASTRMYTGRFSVESEIGGMTLGSRGSLFEFSAPTRFHVSDRLAACGGYRSLSIKGEDGQDNGDVTLKGWHFGLELSL